MIHFEWIQIQKRIIVLNAIAGDDIGRIQLHVGSGCKRNVLVQVVVVLARDFTLGPGAGGPSSRIETEIYLESPRIFRYQFAPEEDQVRLVVSSNDDLCTTVSIQNCSCPLRQEQEDLETAGLRMTVQRSGGVQLARSKYPNGFYVVALIRGSQKYCTGEDEGQTEEGENWVWNDVWDKSMAVVPMIRSAATVLRVKTLTLSVERTLDKSQYALAGGLSLLFFATFYFLFGLLVLFQRFQFFRRFVESKVPPPRPPENGIVSRSSIDNGTRTPQQRRGSDATYDSSDMSESESESESRSPPRHQRQSTAEVAETPLDDVNTPPAAAARASLPRPFGLPARLRLAALARHRARVLRARTDRYLWTLLTVAIFYALPVVQFVIAFQIFMNLSGSLDICYFNFLCAHPAGELTDFNHLFSNIGYLMLGALFLLQVARRQRRRSKTPPEEEYGIPAHYGLLYALGTSLMVVGLLSASYHVCPNRLNFQFDTAFMYVMCVVIMIKIYQSRHPDVNARAHTTFGVLAAIIALGVWGVLGGTTFFWGLYTVIHILTVLLLSLKIYYLGQFRFEVEALKETARSLAALPKRGERPLYMPRLLILLLVNCLNWALALYGLWTRPLDFATHQLIVLLGNALLYMCIYLTLKLLHREWPRWYVWCFLVGALSCWAPAFYFFLSGSTEWATTPARSRHMNHECRLMRFYDSHDLWHLLSSVALYFSFNVLLAMDDGLAAVRREDIIVF